MASVSHTDQTSPANDDVQAPTKLVYVPFVGRKEPRPPYPSLEEAPAIPCHGILSGFLFTWIQPLLVLGYQRTLQPEDLWKMPPEYESSRLADSFVAHFERRRGHVQAWNKSIDEGHVKPGSVRRLYWKLLRRPDGKRKVGIALAMSDTFFWTFWSAGFIKVIGDVASATSPLVLKALIEYATDSYSAAHGTPGSQFPSIGKGIGLAFGLFGMQVVYVVTQQQLWYRVMKVGVLLRGALIAAVYRKAMRLSSGSKKIINHGRLVNHISVDCSRIDECCEYFHLFWAAFLELGIIIGLLVATLGVSSLAGVAVYLASVPLMGFTTGAMYNKRVKALVFTDKRVELITGLLYGMKMIKLFAWEAPYRAKLDEVRAQEMSHIRGRQFLQAGVVESGLNVIPIFGTIVAFVVYSVVNKGVGSAAAFFTSLTLFNLLRLPLTRLPYAWSTILDSVNACNRLTEVFEAEERPDALEWNSSSEYGLTVEDATFKWDAGPPAKQLSADTEKEKEAEVKKAEKAKGRNKKAQAGGEMDTATEKVGTGAECEQETEPFQLERISMKIPKGSLTAIVGTVGSGKSSLLQALIGEMKRMSGQMTFSGPVAYCAQTPWIQSQTLRANVLFGRPFDQARYDQVILDACLSQDIAMLPAGDLTEIGEKGVTLSGGQKQRVNVARSLYADADIYLLDDPLSAVDAHVGQHLFSNAICGALAGKTRILATHALHFLPSVDYVICVDQGKIVQQGTYDQLVADTEGTFALLVKDLGDVKESQVREIGADPPADGPRQKKNQAEVHENMQAEERETGTVKWSVMKRFLQAGGGRVVGPIVLASLLLIIGSTVASGLWLSYWTEHRYDIANGTYAGVYGALGILQATTLLVFSLSTIILGFNASKALHSSAMSGVLRAPLLFFETTPLGRILNRFSKDTDSIDNQLTGALRSALSYIASALASVVLISTVKPYFLAIWVVLFLGYLLAWSFYRTSARELKRIDNFLRSTLYAHFSESLGGLPTIVAYGEQSRFLKQNTNSVDLENRAYLLTIVNQRWLGIRLDLLGCVFVLVVAVIGVGARKTIGPSQYGLMLSFVLQMSQLMTWLVNLLSRVENEMNSVERLLHYSSELESEAPAIIDDSRPPASWPDKGTIKFEKVSMRYRPGLPLVVKDLTLEVAAAEKIGIVGRRVITGAGKSSLLVALFRLVELASGSITIDGVDLSKIGLKDLREKLAIIPQEPLLLNGTIRTNLDPFNQYDDNVLWDALKRASLVDTSEPETVAEITPAEGDTTAATNRITLDLEIENQGANLSGGQQSLVSLARALVKDSKIIVIDEATASVDFETDSKVQDTIHREFKSKTLLCIAHRIRTILNYDRVLVMDAGKIAEIDTPLNLFHQGGIFRSLCDQSGVVEADILAGREEFIGDKRTVT